jgi:hypothetical protein
LLLEVTEDELRREVDRVAAFRSFVDVAVRDGRETGTTYSYEVLAETR